MRTVERPQVPTPTHIYKGLQIGLVGWQVCQAGRPWLGIMLTVMRPLTMPLYLYLLEVRRLGWMADLAGWRAGRAWLPMVLTVIRPRTLPFFFWRFTGLAG